MYSNLLSLNRGFVRANIDKKNETPNISAEIFRTISSINNNQKQN